MSPAEHRQEHRSGPSSPLFLLPSGTRVARPPQAVLIPVHPPQTDTSERSPTHLSHRTRSLTEGRATCLRALHRTIIVSYSYIQFWSGAPGPNAMPTPAMGSALTSSVRPSRRLSRLPH